jgi:hypothetical protein
MDITAQNLSAETIQAFLSEQRTKRHEEDGRREARAKAERDRLHEDFLKLEIPPDALERVALMVRRALEQGERQVLVFQFPSDWLPDQGRSITSRAEDWHAHLDGFARRAYDYYEKELKPRGFQLRAEILDWPNGIPGDVGLFLRWKRADAP